MGEAGGEGREEEALSLVLGMSTRLYTVQHCISVRKKSLAYEGMVLSLCNRTMFR